MPDPPISTYPIPILPTPMLSMSMPMLPTFTGWEWGYWLSDVVTARASWDPLLSNDIRIGKGARTYCTSVIIFVRVSFVCVCMIFFSSHLNKLLSASQIIQFQPFLSYFRV